MSQARLTRISSGPARPAWVIAVFAYNEAGRIQAALGRIAGAAGGEEVDVYVLANGCTDTTSEAVKASGSLVPNLCLVEIDLADKANAWNIFVHEVFSARRAEEITTYFFTDGDVVLEPGALPALALALAEVPGTQAAGGMPATGRDRDAWRERMVINGMLAGNLYALRGSFVQRLRDRDVRMPVGLIGEDVFVSWLVETDIGRRDRPGVEPDCVFSTGALFSFRSSSLWRWRDYRTFLRRKWRYTVRGLQHQMLVLFLVENGLGAMPASVEQLYASGPLPSRLRWVGIDTPMRLVAMLWIRSHRRQAVRGRGG